MHQGHDSRTGIDALLARAWVPVAGRGTPTAGERLARARARAAANAPDRYATALATHAAIAPAHSSCEPEQALRELDLTAVLLLGASTAASLSCLADGRSLDAEGALVFACLLHLTARDEAARFWWRLAAGAGSHVAAYCLCLHHRRHGEYQDADYWRDQAARLRAEHRTGPARGHGPEQPLLPERVRRDLIAQCHKGDRPRLPRALETAVNRLVVDGDDVDFGEIPQPSGRLVEELAKAYCAD
jgi:hypothetical protein